MTLKSFILPFTLTLALVGATPAFAQRGGGGHGGGGGGGHMGSGGGHFGGGGHMGGGGGHAGGGHNGGGRPGGGHIGGGPGGHGGGFDHGHFDRGHFGRGFDGHGHGGPFVHVRGVRPFHGFAFHRRLDLGFGLFLGDPFLYPWGYFEPYPYDYGVYPYPYPNAYPDSYDDNSSEYYDQGANTTQPPADPSQNGNTAAAQPTAAQRNYGGVVFDIKPGDATVTVDGRDAGQAKDYGPSDAPLTLNPGRHHVVISKSGYQPMAFDADVPRGQVLPYQGTMQKTSNSSDQQQDDQSDLQQPQAPPQQQQR
jgi:hypothetical protein